MAKEIIVRNSEDFSSAVPHTGPELLHDEGAGYFKADVRYVEERHSICGSVVSIL